MGRKLSVTEARSQLPLLVKEVAEGNDPIVITTRNEPKAIIIGYESLQRQQQLRVQGAQYVMAELTKEAQGLLQAAQESCHGIGETDLYLFLVNFAAVMRKIWETAEELSPPHALIAAELLDVTELYLAGKEQLQPEHLAVLSDIVQLLLRERLTMEDAAEADRTLLAHGINAMFPVQDDLASLYEVSEVDLL